ncbi:MAG: hypothetical protein LAT62_08635 [Natronospirillum sp.]|uniref:hypothetical protein n=1 Tax=Natronospirillum sp. TaxID=2812955 RepID=UPI0025FB925D|nr:hypothetical protein [Natronospirillum sp.]MCH8551987.1 hypothetical protein [Natronospirillum sp.]
MAVESALASAGLGITPTPGVRRDDTVNAPGNPSNVTSPAVAGNAGPDVALELSSADTGRQALLDRVSANQEAREAVNQVQNSLVEQRELATAAQAAGPDARPDLEAAQADLQAERTELVAQAPSLQDGAPDTPAAGLASALQEQDLVGEADPLPSAEELGAGISRLGDIQDSLNDAEIALQSDFDQLQAEQFRTLPAQQITNPSEADAVLSRVQEQATELPRTSNAIDDDQRQQALNLLQV